MPYTSDEQYHELLEKAKKIHLDMIETHLLRCHAQFARFEVDDHALCTSWHVKQCLHTALLFIPKEIGRMYLRPK